MSFAPQPPPQPLTQNDFDLLMKGLDAASKQYTDYLNLLLMNGADGRAIATAKTQHEDSVDKVEARAMKRIKGAITVLPPTDA
jgi:hypothetical protein